MVRTIQTGSVYFICLLLGLFLGCSKEDSPLTTISHLEPTKDGYELCGQGIYTLPLSVDSTDRVDPPTRFEVLSDSGIDFRNFLFRHRTNLYIETGAGVALADYDGDGLIDVYLTGSDVANKLYRNLGDLKFEDVTDAAGVDGRINDTVVLSSGASFADIDNDGDLDLFVCNMAAPNLLYVNQGDGTFTEQTYQRAVSYSGASKQANFCDFDRDGDLDFYLVTYQDKQKIGGKLIEEVDGKKRVIQGNEEYAAIIDGREEYKVGERDLLYINDGTGHFSEVAASRGISGYDCGNGSVWFDYDDDGWQDIYVGSDFKQPDHLYRNNQDGTFTDVLPDTVSRTPWFSMGVDVGDLNNDGRLDLLVADMADRTHYGQKINMGDMGDSSWFLSYGRPRQFMANCFYLNTGTTRLLELARQAKLAKTDWTWSVRFADLDLDGNQDVFFTNGHARDLMNSDRIAEDRKLKTIEDKELSIEKRIEFNRSIPPRNETNLAYANRGDLEFESVGKEWGLDFHGVSHAAGFADLDLDGDLDCVVNNYYKPSLVYENTTKDGGRLLVELRSSQTNVFGIGSKIEIWQGTDYQRRDLLPGRGYLASDPMMVHFGIKEDQNIDRLRVTWPDERVQEFTDLKSNCLYRVIDSGDAKAIAETPSSPALFADQTEESGFKFAHQESQFDDFSREPLLPFQLSRLGGSVACGDINGDGFIDVYCGGAAGQSGELLVNGDGQFEPLSGPWKRDLNREDMSALFFDADGDGKTDLYVASGSNEFDTDASEYQDHLYRNLGEGKFEDVTETSLPEMLTSSHCVTSVDFDRDGDLDLFVGSRSVPGKYPLTPKSHLLINDDGVFQVADDQVSGGVEDVGLVNSAVWSDFDSDGWPDLLVAVEWGPITVFKNDQGTLVNVTESIGIGDQFGWWHGIAAADLDADGDMDYVVTNQGRNTKYHATPEHPHRLYYDDFDGNGTLDLVESEYEGETEYPVRGRSCSSRCMPFIADKFKTFHDYSLASIFDIYQVQDKPRPVKELRVLDSVVLWNDGESGFQMEALPKLAQISPGYGVCVSDFDSDGYQDILMATNFFGSQPETGYMDGGLGWLLKGGEDRQFKPCWPNESGVIVDGDGNGLALADVDNDGDQDAIFAVNNQAFRMLENRSDASNVRVVVNGVPGNESGIGTRLVLIGDEGQDAPFRQAFEISAGGSYLAQSSAQPSIAVSTLEKAVSIEVHWPDGVESKLEVPDLQNGVLVLRYSAN